MYKTAFAAKLACDVFILLAMVIPTVVSAAVFVVRSTGDSGGVCPGADCTLRQAIATAAAGDTITFSLPVNSTIALATGLTIAKTLTIRGPGANVLTVRRSAASTASPFPLIEIDQGNVAISGLALAMGDGGLFVDTGTVTISDCTIADHVGSGIVNTDTLTIANCTVSGNTVKPGELGGGGIWNLGATTLVSSTVADNVSDFGGGIRVASGSPLVVSNSTIARNTARTSGGGIYTSTAAKLRNSIVAANTAPTAPDFSGTATSQGFNLIGIGTGATIAAATGDQLGTAGAPIDPSLGPLQDNGGATRTLALLAGSKAIDKGDSGGASADQRGFGRTVDSPLIANAGDASDIGAFEVQSDQLAGCTEINVIVNNASDGGAGSLRSVIAGACAGSTITFAANVRGAINLTLGELSIGKSLAISGPGASQLAVQRNATAPDFRIFNITSASSKVTISGLTIANGNMPIQRGGGILNSGKLALLNDAIAGNAALGGNGGGIYNDFGTLTIANSTISGNSVSSTLVAGSGGGLFNQGGTVDINNTTISGNTAVGPGGTSDSGGGIITNVGSVAITNSTITANSADLGGGVRGVNGGVVSARNTLIALNASPSGPDVNGPLTSKGFNLFGSSAGAAITPSAFPDQIGVTAAEINLGPLQDNGGTTKTHALLANSRAIDKGHSGGSITDQRGSIRPSDATSIPSAAGGDGADIGAFEVDFGEGSTAPLVVEFYNASLDHYFITWIANEIAILDAGTQIKGWLRTGYSFKTYATAQAGTSPVCRFYIPPGLGDSHFFGRGTAECIATGQKFPTFVLEDPSFMQMFLPAAGVCPANTTQVYRAFSNRPDANHRYMTDRAVRDQMVAKGWLAEGDGPDLVVMCAPQ